MDKTLNTNTDTHKDAETQVHGKKVHISFFFALVTRCIDIIVSFLGLVVFSPVFLVIYIAVKREDGGAVVFKQERMGYKGKPFTLYKFRSMIVKAEESGEPELYSGESDSRLTRVGRFLREHHLDELPQLWNVLKGDMSFVGYRPEREFLLRRSRPSTPTMSFSTTCVPVCSPTQPFITVTHTPWRRCSQGSIWTSNTYTTTRCGSI